MKNKITKTIKIVKINNKELEKCKLEQKFKVNIFTKVKKPRPTPPDDGSSGELPRNQKPKSKSTKDLILETHGLLLEFMTETRDEFTKINARLDRVIQLNNLKS